jgi:hypothetical protein
MSSALNTLYLLGTSGTYADGTTRTPGVGTAWTWNRETSGLNTVSAYGAPPTNALNMRYIFAGDTSTTTYTPLSPDTATANNLLVAMNKNSGAYTTWTSATPFTSGNFSGFWRMIASYGGIWTVSLWECQEACAVQMVDTTGFAYAAQVGALYDPLVYTTNVTCETDQRLYFLCTTGTRMSASFLSDTTNGTQAFANTPGTSTGRCGYYPPGTGSIGFVYRGGTWTPGAAFTTPSGSIVQSPFWAQNLAGQFLGAARNFATVRDNLTQIEWRTPSGVVGYPYGASVASAADTVILGY